jgi:hypothetical protein
MVATRRKSRRTPRMESSSLPTVRPERRGFGPTRTARAPGVLAREPDAPALRENPTAEPIAKWPSDAESLLALPSPPCATVSSLRRLALPHLGQRDPEIASIAGRAHPALGAIDGLDLRRREHEKLMGRAGLPTDTHPIPCPPCSSDTTDPAVRDADTVAQPYRSGHQSPGVFASSAARRFFRARSCSQRAVTSRTIAAGPSSAPAGS